MTTLVAQEQSRSFDGAEKVAAVLLALDREASQRILKHFDQDELRKITRLAAGLGAVPAAALEEVYSDLIDEIYPARGSPASLHSRCFEQPAIVASRASFFGDR